MNKHLKYLSYVLRHKYHVFKECCRQGIPWKGLVHDWSKFTPAEWFPYVEKFYGVTKSFYGDCGDIDIRFDIAWLKHQNRNKHHWQYWVLMKDNGGVSPLDMPKKYVKEMYADWEGAGKAQGSNGTVREWYHRNKNDMMLSGRTKQRLFKLL